MRKEVAMHLKKYAEEIAQRYSKTDRRYNVNGERFQVIEYKILSAQTACVIYEKSTGKRAIAFFYHVDRQSRWNYFFIGAQHMLNLDKIQEYYLQVENHNFAYNFQEAFEIA